MIRFRGYFGNKRAAATGLDIDFTTGTLDPRITFARASTATYYNSSGLIASAASGAPRFDYDPVTRLPRGLLLEEQCTNNVLQSETFNDAYWNKASVSITANSTTAPDGTTTADLMMDTATGGDSLNYGSTSLANNTWTWSIYVKRGTADWFYLRPQGAEGITYAWFNLATGAVGTVQAGNTATIQPIGGGWYRLTVTRVLTPTYFVYGISNADNSTGSTLGLTVYVWGVQLEAGSFATSYIPTTSAAVARAADAASMRGTNFSSWFNNTEGTFTFDCIITPMSGAWHNLNISQTAAPNANRIVLYAGTSTSTSFFVAAGGVTQVSSAIGTNVADGSTISRFAFAYKTNDFGAVVDGGTVAVDTLGTVPTVDKLLFALDDIETQITPILNVTRLRFFNTRKSDSDLQALTTPPIAGIGTLVAQPVMVTSTTGISSSLVTDTTLNASSAVVSSTTGVSGSTITDTTLNAASAVVSSTTGVSGSTITDTTLNVSSAVVSSTTGLVRAIANPSALVAQAATLIGIGAGTAATGAGVLSSQPATLASTGLALTIGSGALVDSSATLSALAISGSTGIGELDAVAADIDSLGYVEQGGVSIMVNGEWVRTTPYVRIGGTWKPATAWANVNGTWKRVA